MSRSTLKSALQRSKDTLVSIRLHSKYQLLRLARDFKSRSSYFASIERPDLPQWQSPLMSLPWEIRDMIWRHLLGGMLLHLWVEEYEPEKLKGALCRAGDPACRLRCRDWLERKDVEPWPKIGVMGYLLSCRQMYTEGAHYLYAMNDFDTRSGNVIAALPQFLTRERVNAIRSLTLCWTIPKPPSLQRSIKVHCLRGDFDKALRLRTGKLSTEYKRRWIQTWKTLAEMEGLIDLRLELNIVGRGYGWGIRDDQWAASDLEILKAVTRPQSIVLVTSDHTARGLRREVMAPNLAVIGMLEEEKPMGVDLETLQYIRS